MNVLIASTIRNFEPWADRFLDNIGALNNSSLDVCYLLIEGNSTDRSYHILSKWVNSNNSNGNAAALVKYDLPEEMDTMDRVIASIELIADILVNMDYIMLIDADIVETPNNMLTALIEHMNSYNADIIAPYVLIEDTDHFYDTHVFRTNNKRFDCGPPYAPDNKTHTTPFKVDSAGTCLLFKTEVFIEAIAENKKWREACRKDNVDGYICICGTAKRMGYQILADPTVVIRHANLNKYGIQWHDVNDW